MIKVAFWYDRPQEYAGGLNYMRNLLFALSQLDSNQIEPYIFFGNHVDENIVRSFEPYAIVTRTSVLDRLSLAWFIDRVLRTFGSLLMVSLVLRRYGISVLSHSEHVHGKRRSFRVISWIPDFQYLHLPELFPGLDPTRETERLRRFAADADILLLSSYAALNDFRSIATENEINKTQVLQFVSQSTSSLDGEAGTITRERLEEKYIFRGPFFFLPNQFWRHKNHAVVFSAIKALKEQGLDVLLLCTGNVRDYRMKDTSYIDGLLEFVAEHELTSNIKILGLIDYSEVLVLMRNAVSIINPSRFEGWSSTVEEAKSMGQKLILSNIPVHLEQDAPDALYFELDDVEGLTRAMRFCWENRAEKINAIDEEQAIKALRKRTIAYAAGYNELVQRVMSPATNSLKCTKPIEKF
jgi:glycosyltransferase involved in cell wall biosynthesis